MQRRGFLKQTLFTGLTVSNSNVASSCEENATLPGFRGKRLVLVRLDGGNDGIFSLFPKEHDFIDAQRMMLKKKSAENAINLSGDWMLNSDLLPLIDLWERNEMAILPFVGYPKPNTSHFTSSAIWEMGGTSFEIPDRTGWIGRLLDEGRLAIEGNNNPVISISGSETLFDKGVFEQGFSWQGNEFLDAFGGDISHWLDYFRNGQNHDEMFRQFSLMKWLKDIKPSKGFPASELGNQLAQVASMIRTEKPFRIFQVTQSGYDTHSDAAARLNRLYLDLSKSLNAFSKVLRADGIWKDTLVFVYSEFGRTLKENANGGTDHGTAGLCMLLGNNELVSRYSDIPWEINLQTLAGEKYLLHQIDFRDLYRDFTDNWLFI
jgi:uncharacterized protein (DUF1501 family)